MIIFGMIIFMAFPEEILNLFSATPKMKEIGIPMIRIISISYLPVGFSIVCASIFQSLSSAGIALFEPFLRQFIILLPLMYFIGQKTGDIDKIWYSFIIAEFLAGLYCVYFLFLIGKKLSLRRKLLVLLLYEALECLILGNYLGEFLQEEIGRLAHLKNIFQNLSHRHLVLKLNKLLAIEKCENL